MLFRKRPLPIEATQLTRERWEQIRSRAGVGVWVDCAISACYLDSLGDPTMTNDGANRIGLTIPTLEGVLIASEGDWIIRGIKGELYPCKPDVFSASYEPVEAEEATEVR